MAGDSDDLTSPPPIMAIVPTMRLLTVSTLFPGEKLDKELSNWIAWKQAMFQYMGTSCLICYTKSNMKSFCPNQLKARSTVCRPHSPPPKSLNVNLVFLENRQRLSYQRLEEGRMVKGTTQCRPLE